MSAPAKYSRDELARLEASLRELRQFLDGETIIEDPRGAIKRGWKADLSHAADFLAETVAVLDRQKRLRERRKAQNIIERRKSRRR